jgi:hypothetical protein
MHLLALQGRVDIRAMAGGSAGSNVFASYSRADGDAAIHLRLTLADAGLAAFRYTLPGGNPWQPKLEAALRVCPALVVLLGPAGIGSQRPGYGRWRLEAAHIMQAIIDHAKRCA